MPLRKIPDRRVDVSIYNEAMRVVLRPEEGHHRSREFVIDETIAEFVRVNLDERGFSSTYLFTWTPERGARRTLQASGLKLLPNQRSGFRQNHQ